MPERIEAPIQRGDQLRTTYFNKATLAKLPIVAGTSIERMGILEKFLSFYQIICDIDFHVKYQMNGISLPIKTFAIIDEKM